MGGPAPLSPRNAECAQGLLKSADPWKGVLELPSTYLPIFDRPIGQGGTPLFPLGKWILSGLGASRGPREPPFPASEPPGGLGNPLFRPRPVGNPVFRPLNLPQASGTPFSGLGAPRRPQKSPRSGLGASRRPQKPPFPASQPPGDPSLRPRSLPEASETLPLCVPGLSVSQQQELNRGWGMPQTEDRMSPVPYPLG